MPPNRLPSHLQRLKKQLFNRIPVLGIWIRRGAAVALATDSSPQAIEILALALDRLPDAQVQRVVAQTVESVKDSSRIDAVCRAWAQTRSPGLERLIKGRGWVATNPPTVRLLSALKINRLQVIQNGGSTLVAPLLSACEDVDPELAERAQDCLASFKNHNAIDELCEQWVVIRSTDSPLRHRLTQAIVQAGYIAQRPPQARVLSALKNARPDILAQDGAEIVPPLIEALDDPDQTIASQAAQAITLLENPAAREATCQAVIAAGQVVEYNSILSQAVIQGGYTPGDETQRTLFFFLTGQWARYEALDFDHSRLRAIYETTDSALRERLTARLRQAGRAEYLAVLTGRDDARRISQMNHSELNLLVQMLGEQRQWARLWELVSKLPLAWGMRSIQLLAQSGWQPELDIERLLFHQLVPLATPLAMEACANAPKYTPPALERARVRLVHGRQNDVAFHPRQPLIAIGTSRRRVALWNFQHAITQQVISSDSSGMLFGHSIGEVTYTRHGTLVLAERTRGDAHCRVYASRDSETTVIFNETGSITALEPASETGILLTGRSQFTSLLDLDGPAVLVKRQFFPFWPRAACTHPSQPLAALAHHGVELVSLPDLNSIARSATWNQVINCATFVPESQELLIGKLVGDVNVLARRGRQVTRSGKYPITTHKGWVVNTSLVPRYNLLLTAGAEGLVNFISWPGRHAQGQVGKLGENIQSLHVSPDESFMVIAHSDTVLALWDLRTQELPALFMQPLSEATPSQLGAAGALVGEKDLPESVRQALQGALLILQHRFRFDIEIDALPDIKAGEFDIEIE